MKTKLLTMVTLVFLLGVGLTACNNVKDSDLEAKAMEVLANTPDATNIDVTVADKVATLRSLSNILCMRYKILY